MSGPALVERDESVAAQSAPVDPPRRARRWRRPGSVFGWRVAAAVLAGLALRVAIGLTDDAPSTDEVSYIASGTSLVDGDGFVRAGGPELHFPPLMPWLLGAVGRVVGDPHRAAVLLTCLTGAAVVVPVACLGRRLAGDRAGVVAGWAAAVAPGLATLPATRGAGSEAEYTLLVVTAVALATTATARMLSAGRALACLGGAGALVGLAYLTRPEGLAFALPLGAVAVIVGWRGGHGAARGDARRRAGGAIAALSVFAVPILACTAPYAAYLHTHTGRWQLSAKAQDVSIEAWQAVARGDREARDRELYALDGSGLRFDDERAPLAELARRDPAGYGRIVFTNLAVLGKELAGWWLLPMPLWGLVGWAAIRRRRDRRVALVAAVGLIPPAATVVAFFVQPRYLIVTVAAACVLIGVAAAELGPRRRSVVAAVCGSALVGSLATFAGPSGWWHPTDHTDQQAAGEWLAEQTPTTDRIMTRSFVVEHFAERRAVAVPYTDLGGILTFARHYGVRYLVVDETSARRVRPQLVPLLDGAPPSGLRLVHEERAEGRTTRIFALDPVPPVSTRPGPGLGFMGDGG
jgi:4-amino-4-deoxy-L-arabinose transferase-like glycosyltransferase